MAHTTTTTATTNRLAGEKSPYLLQHAGNPVDWYPWGEEAFARARAEDRPIFLSVGYSTCHWCHVMERESFEDPAVAELMNRSFVNVKVDREERPDVDRVYMAYVQAATGSGGWPMSVFLTPDLKPFYGGTYFPPEDRYGRPGFATVLRALAHAWSTRREDVLKSAESVIERLREAARTTEPPDLLGPEVLGAGARVFAHLYDARHGGFGQAPKFPRPVALTFLLRHFAGTPGPAGEESARMVIETLGQMARGGMADHLAGGFHRYSVDRAWHVPHFEKMLYDQAQLTIAYLEGYQVTGDEELARVARATCDYVLADLTAPEGGFFSAEDADSLVPGGDEKAEGAFYVFTAAEIEAALGPDLTPVFVDHYSIEPDGNADDPHGELTGKNVLHVRDSEAGTAARLGLPEAEVARRLAEGRRRLAAVRAGRPRPHLDDKVLTEWNGMMIAALARAHQVLGEPRYRDAAVRAATFLRERMWDDEAGVLRRRYRDGEVAIEGYLEDHAFLAWGLLDLYEATFDPAWLAWAERLTDKTVELFWDGEAGGFYSTSGKDPTVLVRLKEDYDGAQPSGSSIAAWNLLRLAAMTGRADLRRLADETFRHFARRLREGPHAMPQLLVAFDLAAHGGQEVVIAGALDDERTQALLRAVHERFVPRKVVLHASPAIAARLPFVAGMEPQDGVPTAYVCREQACERPTTDPAVVRELLGGRRLGGD